jgi:hypothetical protein
MSYADALSGSRGGAAAAARPPAAAPTPLHHIAYLQGHAVLIDLRAARPNLSKEERNSFLLNDLGISPADVADVFMVPSTQLLRVGFHAEGPCSAALAKLQVGVPWAATDGALVYGWSPADSLSRVRVSGCTPHLDTDLVAAHMAQFGRVVQSARGVDRSFGNVFDGVIHFTIQLYNDITLPHFIFIEDEGGHLAERLFVFSDQHRRRCFRCGHTGHVGQFCRTAIKASGATEALWSKMVSPAGAPAPPPVVFAVPSPPPPPAAVLPPVDAAAAPGRDASPPSEGVGSLPCGHRSRSGSMSSVASEAAGD